jgi:hypothetical protein
LNRDTHCRDARVLAIEPGAIGGWRKRANTRRSQIGGRMAGDDVERARQLENGECVCVHGLNRVTLAC